MSATARSTSLSPSSLAPARPGSEDAVDAALVAAVRAGDERAFEQLYRRYGRRIAAYVLGMVRDHGRAEDITQEVFLAALRRMRATDRDIAFRPWIYEIAKNACIDQHRRSRRAVEVSFDAAEAEGGGVRVAAGPELEAMVGTKLALDDLCGAFGGLSDTHHRILVMRELEGLSYREIGERLDLNRAGVESTLFRARRRLAQEHDELVSGERCRRVRAIVAAGARTTPGRRDQRRLAAHISHCQPCRRHAYAAGLEVDALIARGRVRARVAAIFPLPEFLRRQVEGLPVPTGRGGALAPWAAQAGALDPAALGWMRAAAAATAVAVLGLGAGHGGNGLLRPETAARPVAPPAAAHAAAPAPMPARLPRVTGPATTAGIELRPAGALEPAAPAAVAWAPARRVPAAPAPATVPVAGAGAAAAASAVAAVPGLVAVVPIDGEAIAQSAPDPVLEGVDVRTAVPQVLAAAGALTDDAGAAGEQGVSAATGIVVGR